MSSLERGRQMIHDIYGRSETPNNLAIKSKAHIYHALILHNEAHVSSEILDGIKKVALKLFSKEDIKKLEEAHASQKKHRL